MVAYFQFEGVKNNDDLETIKKSTEELSTAVRKIGEKLYSAAKEKEETEKSAQGESGSVGEDTDKKPEEGANGAKDENKDDLEKESDESKSDEPKEEDKKE